MLCTTEVGLTVLYYCINHLTLYLNDGWYYSESVSKLFKSKPRPDSDGLRTFKVNLTMYSNVMDAARSLDIVSDRLPTKFVRPPVNPERDPRSKYDPWIAFKFALGLNGRFGR